MFNLGTSEIALIAIAALLLLGPKRLPELARGIGKFMREFRRQTDEVRGVVEREFYRMDQEVSVHEPPLVQPAPESVAMGHPTPPAELPAVTQPIDAENPSGAPSTPEAPLSPTETSEASTVPHDDGQPTKDPKSSDPS